MDNEKLLTAGDEPVVEEQAAAPEIDPNTVITEAATSERSENEE